MNWVAKTIAGLVMIWLSFPCLQAQVKLSNIFGSNMVLQRDKPCNVWGSASPGEKIKLRLDDNSYSIKADKMGKWLVTLPAHPAGGPHQITVSGKNSIVLSNILFGDVWICGGQSNMQFRVSELAVKETDSIRNNNNAIRLFTAATGMNYTPQDTLAGGTWKETSVQSIQDFSAVAYFFGRTLQEKLHVPIGLISDNLGATSAEEWMSNEAIGQYPQFQKYYQAYLEPGKSFKTLEAEFGQIKEQWNKDFYMKDDPGFAQQWFLPGTDTTGWKKMSLPGYWEDKDKNLADYDGSVWYRRTFDQLPRDFAGNYHLGYGPADDYDIAWINGVKVGEGYGNLNLRSYTVPAGLVKSSGNVVVVRVFDAGNKGGMYNMFWNQGAAGEWLYKPGIKINAADFKRPLLPNAYVFGSPAVLYNANIAPLTRLQIKGFAWYQGEGNAGRAEEYRTLFPAMIRDWRTKFNQESLPFYFVQLANFMAEKDQPQSSEWAELRAAQDATLSLPNTGMACAIDIGEANDIHPKNKQDVGKRLALAALKTTYGFDTIKLSPRYQQMQVSGDSIVIKVDDQLICRDKYGYVEGFSIAGADHVFHWAKAYLRDGMIVVYGDDVKSPVAARYAWADNPGQLDLYNKEGLPLAPFRTDDWPGITKGKTFSYTE